MCFDVTKIVRSPECDHGHDEESRNGRDMKIDILEGYVWRPEWFRGVSDIYRSTGGLPEPPGEFSGPRWALVEKRRAGQGRPRAPSPPSPNRTRKGGVAPPFPLSPPPFPSPPRQEGGAPLPVGVGLLQAHPLGAGRTYPSLLYIRGQGAPHNNTS